jgi:hypothetical protein
MAAVKTVGSSGQIALGKQYAGQQVLVDQVEPGVWLIKVGEFVPDSERWLFRDSVAADLDEAIGWAEDNPPGESDMDALDSKVSDR